MKNLITLTFVLMLTIGVFAQDLQLTQFYAAPMNLNPAMAGYFNGDKRFGINYRDQWGAFRGTNDDRNAFITMAAYADIKLLRRPGSGDYVGGGMVISSDRSGEGNLGWTRIEGNLAYHKALDRNGEKTYVSIGIGGGYFMRTIGTPEELIWDDQFEPSSASFNPQINTGEPLVAGQNYNIPPLTGFSITPGALISHAITKKVSAFVGFSAHHINNPVFSFYGDNQEEPVLENAKLGTRMMYNGGMYLQLSKDIQFEPAFSFATQRKADELILGGNFGFSVNDFVNTKFYVGLWSHFSEHLKEGSIDEFIPIAFNDFVPLVGLEYKQWLVMLNYNFVLSHGTSVATDRQRGYELSARYILKDDPNIESKTIPCIRF